MKVGILTFPNSISYGAVLQMYALHRTVEKLGYQPEIINYHNAYMKREKHVAGGRALKYTAKKVSRRIVHFPMYHAFRAFEKKCLTFFPKKPFQHKAMLEESSQRYDAVVCGSDQVWNPYITNGDTSYFLDFCGENTRRISYAPSFGVDQLSPEYASLLTNELHKFYAISVREESGKTLIKDMIGADVPVVADPTMLLSTQEWQSVEEYHPLGNDAYILYYTIRNSASLWKYCQSLSEKTGLKIVVVGGNLLSNMKSKNPNLAYAVDISPEQWIYLVDHARYVVTNSFHGTAFSVIFRKDFYVEFSSATNSRLEHITSKLGLQRRVVGENMADETEKCDYLQAEKQLSEICRNSIEYLQKALDKGEKNG